MIGEAKITADMAHTGGSRLQVNAARGLHFSLHPLKETVGERNGSSRQRRPALHPTQTKTPMKL